jgi:hypothetical protein
LSDGRNLFNVKFNSSHANLLGTKLMGILFEEKELQSGTLDPDNTEYTLLDQA